MFTKNLKLIIFNPKFLISILCIPLCILMDNVIDIAPQIEQGSGSLFYYYFGSLCFNGLFGMYVALFFVTFPFATSYIEERNNGLIYPILAKNGTLKYTKDRFFSCVFSGGLILALGYLVLFLTLSIKMPFFMEHEWELVEDGLQGNGFIAFTEFLAYGNGWPYFAVAIFVGFLRGALYSAVTLTLTTFVNDSFFAYTASVFSFYFFNYFYFWLGVPNEFTPDMWLLTRCNVLENDTLTIALSIVYVALMLALTYFIFNRRVRYNLWYKK